MADPSSPEMTGGRAFNGALDVRFEKWVSNDHEPIIMATAARSISDWKNDYLDICRSCMVRDACGGVFTTSGNRLSKHLHPIS
jgi:hypothetical protein